MIDLLLINRINRRCSLLVIGLFCIILFNVNYSVAEEITVESVPELMRVSRCSAQGGSISILRDQPSDSGSPCAMIVYNSYTGQTVSFDSGIWLAPAIFYDQGNRFLTATVKVIEGPTTYTVYDLDGNKLDQFITRDRLTPSESGKFFYTESILTAPAKPVVYNSDFSILKEFKIGEDVAANWDATILGDSLYILSDRFTIKYYGLPSFNVIGEYNIELGPGIPTHRLYCNENGTLCALSNYRSLGIVNTTTGFTQTIPFEFVDKIHLSSDGNHVYSIRGQHEYMTIQEFGFDGKSFTEVKLDEIVFADYMPGPVKAIPDRIVELPDGIAVNLSILHGSDPRTDRKSVATMLAPHNIDQSKSVQYSFIEGLVWRDDTENSAKLKCITSISASRAQVKDIKSLRKEVTNE